MFDIGWVEMAVIAVLMIIVIGPKDLPKVLHTLGQWIGQARALARSFQDNLDDMVRESGIDDVRKEIETAVDYDIGGEITKTIDSDGKIAGALDMKDLEDDDEEDEAADNVDTPETPETPEIEVAAPDDETGDETGDEAEPAKDTADDTGKETGEPER